MKRLVLLIVLLVVCRAAEIDEEDEDYLPDYDDYDQVDDRNPEEDQGDLEDEAKEEIDTTKNWQDFSKGSSLSLSVSMNEIERYFIRFPCSESVQFTLHLIGEKETNSYIEFSSKEPGRIFCNKAGTQSFNGGAYGMFNIAKKLICEDNGHFMVLEVENRRSIYYSGTEERQSSTPSTRNYLTLTSGTVIKLQKPSS